ncbi:MAG: response regulator [Nitrospirota bacterium]|nr:response regulator [Nitrospirota bacterium]
MVQNATILVVDDTPFNVKLLVDLLGIQGYTMVTATTGPEALEKVAEERPDLVLLDVVMPGMDGFEVCRKIRENPETTLLPVVLVTAMYPVEQRARGIEVGADDFLTKPINQAELLARVRSLLRIKVMHDAIQSHAGELTEWNRKLEIRLAQEAKLAEVARSLGDIGHEVRDQTTPIKNGIFLLQEEINDLFGRLPESERYQAEASQKLCQEIIKMVTNGAHHIQERVGEIADCVKGLSSPLHLVPCQVKNVVSSVVRMLNLEADQKRVSLRIENLDSLPLIQADERRLFNAFYNLINNAIPEVSAGGSITIQGRADPEARFLFLSVADTGRGMPPEIRESLFSARAISRKHGGTGLGTKIVKDVVDAHGGSITVESEEGIGTTFHLHLPLEPA